MNFQQCLIYLEQIQRLGVKFGLDNVRAILDSLGNPHQRYPSVLVAGTNGKGSVCAMLTRILTLHGFRVGLYTSPHLVSVRERIRVGEELISETAFSRRFSLIRDKIEELIRSRTLLTPPTYFEFLSCLAFLHFQEEKVDLAVLEVGMGGRFDATNVVHPLVSIFTTISLEHEKFLGETPEQIAFEKSGIMRPGVAVVCGVEEAEASTALRKRAEEIGAPFYDVFERKDRFTAQPGAGLSKFIYRTEEEKYAYSPGVPGYHQGKNAAVVISAAERLSRLWKKLKKSLIIRGLETVRWEGRLEVFSKSPLIILDGAHNEEGARSLRNYIQDFLSTPVVLVFAQMRDKNTDKLADLLFPLAEKVILTQFPYYRALSPEDIQERASCYRDKIILEHDVSRAVRHALGEAKGKKPIIIAGSLFLVGEVKKQFPKGL